MLTKSVDKQVLEINVIMFSFKLRDYVMIRITCTTQVNNDSFILSHLCQPPLEGDGIAIDGEIYKVTKISSRTFNQDGSLDMSITIKKPPSGKPSGPIKIRIF